MCVLIIKNDDEEALKYLFWLDSFIWSKMPHVGLGWGDVVVVGLHPLPWWPSSLRHCLLPLALLRLGLVQLCCLIPSFFSILCSCTATPPQGFWAWRENGECWWWEGLGSASVPWPFGGACGCVSGLWVFARVPSAHSVAKWTVLQEAQ